MASKYDQVYMCHIADIKAMVQGLDGEIDVVVPFSDLSTVGDRQSYKGYIAFQGTKILSGNAAHVVALVRFIAFAIEQLQPEIVDGQFVLFMNKDGGALLLTKDEADKRATKEKQVTDEEIRQAIAA